MAAVDRPLDPDGQLALDLPLCDHPCPARSRPFVLAATILASAMAFIDGTVVSIALPEIQRSLDAGILALQWVVNAYLLVLGALILAGGGLGDRLGRRRLFVTGIAIFAIASLFCAAAPNAEVLIAARALQGIGAALLVPQSLAIIAANFPKDVRGRAIGTWAAASAVTTALGPPVGGFLIDFLSWRAAFWINLPLSAAAIWLTWRHVPESRDDDASGAIDWTGTLIAVVALGALTFAFSRMSQPGASPWLIGVVIATGIAGVFVFLAVERRAENPISAPSLFRSRVFAVVNVVTVLLYGALSGVLFLLPFDLLSLRGMTAAEAGLALLPFGVIIGAFSRLSGSLADKYGTRLFLAVGSAVVSVACLSFAVGQDRFWLGVVLPLLLLAGGMAIVVSPLTTAVMQAAPDEKAGAASGVSNAASRLAGGLAVAVFGTIAGIVFSWLAPEGTRFGVIPPTGVEARSAVASAFVSAYAVSMIVAAIWAAAASAAAFFLLPDDRSTRLQPAVLAGRRGP